MSVNRFCNLRRQKCDKEINVKDITYKNFRREIQRMQNVKTNVKVKLQD